MANGRSVKFIVLMLLASVVLIVASLAVGYYTIPVKTILQLFTGGSGVPDQVRTIVFNIRIPRIVASFLVGAGLSVSGAAFQGMFKNPLVSPDILGVSMGAGLGASLAISLGLSALSTQAFAFAFGIATVFLSYFIGSRAKFDNTVSLVLAGTMLGALANSLISVLKYIADPNDVLPAITFWLMGSFAKVDFAALQFSAVPMLVAGAILLSMRWKLNLLTLGDEEAKSIGINPGVTRLAAITAATVICSAAVCASGVIGWVGLMIPHMARGILGADYRRLLPASCLLGGFYLLLMDDLARSLISVEIPIGVLTSICGVPFFIFLIVNKKKGAF